MTVAEIVAYVKQQFGIVFSVSGMTDLLHRLNFVYKKLKVIPGKADAQAQEAFLETYENLKENKKDSDPIYFMDGVHPQHNTMAGYGWIKTGEDHEIPSNTGRQRLNINGAINIQDYSLCVHFDDCINAQSTIGLLQALERRESAAEKVYVICDNAAYYRSKRVSEYLQTSKMQLVFLPPYSPNLNLIERYWKFFKKKVLYNRYYEKFSEFKQACMEFFKQPQRYINELRSLLAENFQIINAQ